MSNINSEEYWDQRFKADWDEKSGDEQSKFFMNIAFDMFPTWLNEKLAKDQLAVCDWGCAEGDGTYMLASKFSKSKICGIDFSVNAIQAAQNKYNLPNLEYNAIDLLTTDFDRRFDVVFSSNVFEHFHEPWKIFDRISTFAESMFIMLVPYNEDPNNLHDEHFYSFSANRIKHSINGWSMVHFGICNTAEINNTHWAGQQALIVFARDKAVDSLGVPSESLLESYALLQEESTLSNEILNNNLKQKIYHLSKKIDVIESGLQLNREDSDYNNMSINQVYLRSKNGSVLKNIVYNNKQNKVYKANYRLLDSTVLFDKQFYLSTNRDVKEAGVDPIEHYLIHGYKENRQPSIEFDQAYYLAKYADIRVGNINPLVHYLTHGINEHRSYKLDGFKDKYMLKNGLALQLEAFDKGGLEEVVLSLASNKSITDKFNVYIFVINGENGHLQNIAEDKGIKVVNLNGNLHYLDYLIKKLNIKICNLHYSVFGLSIYKANNVKTTYTIHNNYIWADEAFVKERIPSYEKVDKFVAVSSQVKEFFVRKFNFDATKIDVITNGLDIANLPKAVKTNRQIYGYKTDDYIFICVASFTPNKYHMSLIRAFAELVKTHPHAKLLLVGNVLDQKYYQYLMDLIKHEGINDSVKITDFVKKDELLGLLQMSDSFVLTSLTEGFSIATLEALYSNLPLILTDVGGAKDLINNGVGIAIPNASDDMQTLNDKTIKEVYCYSDNTHNKDNILNALTEFITNRAIWKSSASTGKAIIKDKYSISRVAKEYINFYESVLFDNEQLKRITALIHSIDIVFIAPYPTKERLLEGWMSRISAIDSIIGNRAKVYINVVNESDFIEIKKYKNDGFEITIGTRNEYYCYLFDAIVKHGITIYAHTLHLAEYVLPWMKRGNVVVDIHGITPEEEVMLGHPYLKDKYESIEQQTLLGAKACVMVTKAMLKHYQDKYPNIKAKQVIFLPIVENIEQSTKTSIKNSDEKYKIVYSGGTQEWQNVPAMMKIADKISNYADVTFLSHDWKNLAAIGTQLMLPQTTKYKFCSKDKLHDEYKKYDFGLVLRDDTAVNRVSCPTKLYEYMMSGIIPIVRTEKMGDFKSFGFAYVTEKEILQGKLPTGEESIKMLKNNYAAAKKMQGLFKKGDEQLRLLLK